VRHGGGLARAVAPVKVSVSGALLMKQVGAGHACSAAIQRAAEPSQRDEQVKR